MIDILNRVNLICFVYRPRPGDPPRIERDDFPAPPYPYTDPERRRRWSESSKKVSVSDSNDFDDRKYERRDVVDGETDETPDDPKVKVINFISLVLNFITIT